MNERIRALALQALKHPDTDNDGLTVFDNDELAKFTQLIVQECIDKIETYRIPVGNSAAGEMACEWTYEALKEIGDEIREHFGEEE